MVFGYFAKCCEPADFFVRQDLAVLPVRGYRHHFRAMCPFGNNLDLLICNQAVNNFLGTLVKNVLVQVKPIPKRLTLQVPTILQ